MHLPEKIQVLAILHDGMDIPIKLSKVLYKCKTNSLVSQDN